MPRSPDRPGNLESARRNRPLTYAINRLVVVIAYAVIVGLLLSAVAQAFAVGLEVGLRSLAAAALPPIILAYSSFFSRSVKPPSRVLEVNLFGMALLWILVLLILVDFVSGQFSHTLPLGEFLISLTLGGLFYFGKRLSSKSLLSCSYGILAGFLIHILIFGLWSF
ncbi:MAG: hypothetical protein EDM05_65020 [Leptolyngbya sp. IPPAS B-1204]|nr:hypothetical protein [Elainella sp. C42_A2020_010]RNJ70073.1 MAG: hypothetical protein EDM05_05085 [Leptolyngbya sp. IPPAS B-1204]